MTDEEQETDIETESANSADPTKGKEKLLEKAFGPASEEFGERIRPIGKDAGEVVVATVKTAKMLLAPVRAVVWGADKIEDWLHRDVDGKLKRVPEDRRIEPTLALAGPTVEAMRFIGGTPELRDMFGNLLANAMDANTARNAHPSFVEIIKQLSPDEARILRLLAGLLPTGDVPMLEVRSEIKGKDKPVWKLLIRYFSHVGDEARCQHPDLVGSYIDNLCRLELCRVPSDIELADDEEYKSLENDPRIKALKAQLEEADEKLRTVRRAMIVTDFGRQFIAACVVPKSS